MERIITSWVCVLCACLAGPKFVLCFLCLFVCQCVRTYITSAIITSHNLLLLYHAARLYFGRLDGCFEYWCSYYE